MADTPVQVNREKGEREGQAQVREPYKPHDGRHYADETAVITDRVITDANHPDAVQVPEGVGASTAGHTSPLADALSVGTVQEQFDREAKKTSKDKTTNK